jgi:alkyldihydroxyacetonephosphate synthase
VNQAQRKQLVEELAAVVGREHVQHTPRALREIGVEHRDGDAPAWWLRPGSAAEVSELIRIAARERVAVIPVGTLARAPRADAVRKRLCFFVDSRRMDHVLHLDETSLIVHVQAGLTAHALETILAPRGLTIGDYPPSALNATIGGLLAVRTPGKSSPRHGFLEDAVLGLSAVMADGSPVHTRVAPRRATGPDLARALCGCEGTLGLITSVVLRIHRRAESRLLDAHVLPSFDAAVSSVRLALREDASPAAIRVYDGAEALAHLGEGVCRRGEAVLVVATAGPTDLAAVDRDLVASAANAMGGRPLGAGPAEIWWRRRTGHDDGPPPLAAALQIAATPGNQMPVYRAVLEAAESAGAAARAHASRFDADGAVIFFAFTQRDGEPLDDETLARIVDAAAEVAQAAGAIPLGYTNPEVNAYLVSLRQQLDPHDIMNPAALTR